MAKRVLLLLCHVLVPSVEACATVTSGVMVNSLLRYMPSPAGLSDIDVRSAPSDTNAPPIPITRAVPKTCVRLNSAKSDAHSMSRFTTEPPNP